MFRHVLVAYDGSERAQDALALALRLRDPDSGRITLACALTEHRPWHHPKGDVPEEVGIMLAAVVVVGSSRRISDGRIRLERTAGRLLQGAPCAVAVAPPELRESEPFRHVGIAYDGSREARVALATGYAIAAACEAAVTVAYAQVKIPDT